MRGLAWGGCVLVLVACTRENGAFEGSGGGGTATTGSGGGITTGDGVDGPQPATGSASGSASGVDGNTADDAPPLTTGPQGTSEEGTTTPPQGTTTGGTEEGSTSAVMEGESSTGFDDPITCCMGESCNNPDIADDCVCNLASECCVPGPWNLYCTAVAVQSCGLACVPPPGDCCMVHEGVAGCDDFEVMVCVCSGLGNADCCSIGWTEECVAYAAESCLKCGG